MKKNLQVKKLWVSKETLEGGLKKVWFQTIFGSKKSLAGKKTDFDKKKNIFFFFLGGGFQKRFEQKKLC